MVITTGTSSGLEVLLISGSSLTSLSSPSSGSPAPCRHLPPPGGCLGNRKQRWPCQSLTPAGSFLRPQGWAVEARGQAPLAAHTTCPWSQKRKVSICLPHLVAWSPIHHGKHEASPHSGVFLGLETQRHVLTGMAPPLPRSCHEENHLPRPHSTSTAPLEGHRFE